jgi:uncharacterized membrane protein
MNEGLATFIADPAVTLSVLVGAFHTCVYVFVRGRLGWHVPAVLVGAILGALAGQAIGARIGDVLYVGGYSLLWASALAWMGIGIAVVSSALLVRRPEPPPAGGQVRPRQD